MTHSPPKETNTALWLTESAPSSLHRHSKAFSYSLGLLLSTLWSYSTLSRMRLLRVLPKAQLDPFASLTHSSNEQAASDPQIQGFHNLFLPSTLAWQAASLFDPHFA